ncbi:sialate O-acetylesterase [Pontibacter sp. 13R65]|uniref:sialate O-acetylesterase n=1 Tax=Pontibacter sp. 13R65 TaxID=3127458 RepID=UPI00301DA734
MRSNNIISILKKSVLLLSVGALSLHAAEAKVVLPAVFSDNMVLQQKDKVPFFGTATPNSKLTIKASWDKKNYTTQADKKGNWQITIPTPAAGRGFEITFNDGEELKLNNVLVGEVWVCSGQSNMEMHMAGQYGNVLNAQQEIAAANYPEIRFLTVENITSNSPLKEAKIKNGGWEVCSPQTVRQFSAVGYFFARDIHKSQNVPIGIINTSWGGTIAEAWTSGPSLKTMPAFVEQVKHIEQNANNTKSDEMLLSEYEQEKQKFYKLIRSKDAGYNQESPNWASASLNTSSWKPIPMPGVWETKEMPGFDGVVWLRKKVSLPAAWAGKELRVNIGPVDDDETTFFNGEEVGQTVGYGKLRSYKVPAKLVKVGDNVVTVRVGDNGGDGGLYGHPDELFLTNATGEKISLAGEWLYQPAVDYTQLPPSPQYPVGPNRTTVLYNAMVHPLTKLPIKGAIWYQGESNAGRAYQYRTLFPLLINDWRKSWGRGDFPFYFVQLANYMQSNPEPGESDWAELREAQLMTLKVPNTGMAVAIDIGEEKDIHPKNKQEVGRRLALAARAKTYNEKIAFSGPAYKSMKVEGNSIRLSFDHTNKGLQAKGGNKLTGFAIAGADKKFHWAEATIVGNEVLVSSPEVQQPVAVRYGWAANPKVNFYNGEGLPASPFRTDTWQGVTQDK